MTIIEFLFILQFIGFLICFIGQIINCGNYGKKYDYKWSFINFIIINICWLLSLQLMMVVDYSQSEETLIYPVLNDFQTMLYYVSWLLVIVEMMFLMGVFSLGAKSRHDPRNP